MMGQSVEEVPHGYSMEPLQLAGGIDTSDRQLQLPVGQTRTDYAHRGDNDEIQ